MSRLTTFRIRQFFRFFRETTPVGVGFQMEKLTFRGTVEAKQTRMNLRRIPHTIP